MYDSFLNIAMEHWKYGYNCNQIFPNELNFSIK